MAELWQLELIKVKDASKDTLGFGAYKATRTG